jgi:Bacterial protein of unknown function (DUF839)
MSLFTRKLVADASAQGKRRWLSLVAASSLMTGVALMFSGPAVATPSTTPNLTVIAGTGVSGAAVPGPAASSPIEGAYAITTDQAGDIYSASDNQIVEITPSGTLSIVAGNGITGAPVAGSATSSPLDYPDGLAVDSSGNLYISNEETSQILKVTPSGTLSIIAGTGTAGHVVPGPASSSPLDDPWGLGIDSSGNLYVGFYSQYGVAKITPGGTISIVAGNGAFGHPVPGPALDSPMGSIAGFAFDSKGDVYMSDYYECDIYKVTPSGTLSIYAGTTTCNPEVPGPATSSPIGYLYGGMAMDSAGNLFFADTGDNTFDKVSSTGTLSIVAGIEDHPGAPTPGDPTSSNARDPYAVAVDSDGNLYLDDFGNYDIEKVTGVAVPAPTPAPASGYWLVGSDGGVFSFGASFYGSATTLHLSQPVVGISSTSDGLGYLLVGRDGGVFAYGDAKFKGSVVASGLSVDDIVGIATDPTTGGYWLVGSNGGVFSYDAPFYGSLGTSSTPVDDIVGIASTANGHGYYLVGSNGDVYPFGNATLHGESSTITNQHSPIVGIAVDSTTGGYWETAANGGVFAYGAPFAGSMGASTLSKPIVGISASASNYELVGGDGGVFAYGQPFDGSMAGHSLAAPVVGATIAG